MSQRILFTRPFGNILFEAIRLKNKLDFNISSYIIVPSNDGIDLCNTSGITAPNLWDIIFSFNKVTTREVKDGKRKIFRCSSVSKDRRRCSFPPEKSFQYHRGLMGVDGLYWKSIIRGKPCIE